MDNRASSARGLEEFNTGKFTWWGETGQGTGEVRWETCAGEVWEFGPDERCWKSVLGG